jgi:hypothetical protein
MTFDSRERSRYKAQPITLYSFGGGSDNVTEAGRSLEHLIRSVTIIPGATEFGYAQTRVYKYFNFQVVPENFLTMSYYSDFEASIQDLMRRAPYIEHVSLVVSWHGTDLRLAHCQIIPKVDLKSKQTHPWSWRVGNLTRSSAPEVSYYNGKPAIGGAPDDRSVYEAIKLLKYKGLRVTLYPFITMDIPHGNSLPNPYGGTGQPAYPWRGRITCDPAPGVAGTVDKTPAAAEQVAAFFGSVQPSHFSWNTSSLHVNYSGPANEWSFRRLILHLATIAVAAGGVDDFLIGSEMLGLTTIRSSESEYPAVAQFKQLAADVRSIVGPSTRISYAADWSEYHSHRPADGSGDVYFHLDPLWADPNIDFVGIDNYLPTADWRDGTNHLDYLNGWKSIYDHEYLKSNIEGGEYYDWYYVNKSARDNQVRTPITDGLGKPWVFRNKDIRNWWLNQHFNRPSGVEAATPTEWVPQSKPIVFTEIGCGAIDKGANEPNKFLDPKSAESVVPHYSSGARDDLMQRVFLEAWLSYWRPEDGRNPISSVYGGPMIDWRTISIWTWDARPYPAFPNRIDFWGDGSNWYTGHWLTGRLLMTSPTITSEQTYHYTNAERPVTVNGVTYKPIPVNQGRIVASGTLDNATLEIQLPSSTEVAELFRVYPPSHVVTLVIRQGHLGETEFPVVWTGRVVGASRTEQEVTLQCEPVSTSLARPGLRRNYQHGCPHALYGPQCNANMILATTPVTVESVSGSIVKLPNGWTTPERAPKYISGMVRRTTPSGIVTMRTILNVTNGRELHLTSAIPDLAPGDTIEVILGCNHQMDDCMNLHYNIHNFGGCPWIPKKNPMGFVNNFY